VSVPILSKIEDHTKADEDFYITAPKILNLANRALEIFESSEVKEKRALINLLLQNPLLSGQKLLFSLRSPFYVIAKCGQTKNWLPLLDAFRTFKGNITTENVRLNQLILQY